MDRIEMDKVKIIAKNAGIVPGRVKGTGVVQLTKGNNPEVEVITWDDFEEALAKRGIAVYESGGWMKIMKDTATA